ncbi:MAG: peptidase C15 [Pseudomonadota bacterium]
MSRILVTGFGPFPGVPVNPSEALVRTLEKSRRTDIVVQVLPTRWDCWGNVSVPRDVTCVLMFGVAANARRIRYERLSRPGASSHGDVDGFHAGSAPRRSRRSALPVSALVDEARAAGFPVVASADAGRYVCNASYGAALADLPQTLFVHIPMPRPYGALSAQGLANHAQWLIGRLRQRQSQTGRPAAF